MTRISRFKLSDVALNKLSVLFFEIVAKQNDKERFEKIICDLLSSTERIMIAKRIAITYLLLKNIDHREICNVLKVSTATVAKFALLSERSTGLVPEFITMLRNEKFALFLLEIFITLFSSQTYGVNWGAARRREKMIKRLKEVGI